MPITLHRRSAVRYGSWQEIHQILSYLLCYINRLVENLVQSSPVPTQKFLHFRFRYIAKNQNLMQVGLLNNLAEIRKVDYHFDF